MADRGAGGALGCEIGIERGEAFRAAGRDARLMREFADHRALSAKQLSQVSEGARELLDQWAEDGWVRVQG